MEVHRQTCQACGSRSLRNLLVRDHGKNDRVFVECNDCHELVARYIISPNGYYHHGKGYESYLRGLMRSGGEQMSGKNMQTQFKEVQEDCLEMYDKVKAYLQDNHHDD